MISGGCLCGRVRYESPGPVLFSVVCHCRDCQRASGAGRLPVMGVPKATFQVHGEARTYANVGGSGQTAGRNFCPHCGSLLFGTPDVVPDIITIYVGTLDDPQQFKPDHAIFARDRQAWDELNDAVVAYATTRGA